MRRRNQRYYSLSIFRKDRSAAYKSRHRREGRDPELFSGIAVELGTLAEELKMLPLLIEYSVAPEETIPDILESVFASPIITYPIKQTIHDLYMWHADDRRKLTLRRNATPAPALSHMIDVMAGTARSYANVKTPQELEEMICLAGFHDTLEDSKDKVAARRHVAKSFYKSFGLSNSKAIPSLMKDLDGLTDDSPPALDRVIQKELKKLKYDKAAIANILSSVKKFLNQMDRYVMTPALGQPFLEHSDVELIAPYLQNFQNTLPSDAASVIGSAIFTAFNDRDFRRRLFRFDQKMEYAASFAHQSPRVVEIKMVDLRTNVRDKISDAQALYDGGRNREKAREALAYCTKLYQVGRERNLPSTAQVLQEIRAILPDRICVRPPTRPYIGGERYFSRRFEGCTRN